MEQKSAVLVVKEFFGMPSNVFMPEWKALSVEDKRWFAVECAKEMGVEIDPATMPK